MSETSPPLSVATAPASAAPRTVRPLVFTAMAVCSGATVANVYLAQPLLQLLADALGVSKSSAGVVVTCAQFGYAAGILLLVPLGDIRNRRPLILAMMAATTLALAGAAIAPSVGWLAAAGFLVGLFTAIPQVVLPLGVALNGGERSGHCCL